MTQLLEILGRGLLAELRSAFADTFPIDPSVQAAELQDRVRQEPNCSAHHDALGIHLLAKGELRKACQTFNDALRIDERDQIAGLALACVFDEQGRTSAAVEQLRITLTDHAESEASWFALGFCLEKLSDEDGAVAAYDRALALSPNLRNAHERLAAIHLKNDRLEAAISRYEHICFCESDDIGAALILANLYVRDHQYDTAVQKFEHALTLDPENWEARSDQIDASIDAGRFDEAIEALTELIERRPDRGDLFVRLGDMFRAVGREEKSLAAFRRAVELNPDLLEATVKLGTGHLRMGRFAEAAEMFSRAAELNDRTLSAYVGMGVAQQAQGRSEEAAASFEMAAAIEPNSTMLFSEMARLQLVVTVAEQRERYMSPAAMVNAPHGPVDGDVTAMIDQQILELGAATVRHPNHADLHYRLGLLLRYGGDLDGAIGAFMQAVAINPNYYAALTKLGLALREKGNMDAAVKTFERALAINRQDVDLHYQLGLIFADRGQFALAVHRFEQAAKQCPEKLDCLANLALSLQDMGLLDRAAAAWQTLCEVAEETAQGRKLRDTLLAPSRSFP